MPQLQSLFNFYLAADTPHRSDACWHFAQLSCYDYQMRSFEIVEFKLFEADFSLDKLSQTRNPIEAEFYFSAFLSASQSVTFALQASIGKHPQFAAWYEQQQDLLRRSDLAAWFLNARNASQHEGATFIRMAEPAGDVAYKFFERSIIEPNETLPDTAGRWVLESMLGITSKPDLGTDIATKCRDHLTNLLRVIHNCFQVFGPVIDSAQYYTSENMRRLQKTVEDFEVELGFPSGWTAALPEDRRLIALCHEAGETEIDELFSKYLGVDRFGRKCSYDQNEVSNVGIG